MPLDPKAKELLDAAAAMGGPPISSIPPEIIRQGIAAQTAQEPKGPECHRIEDMDVAGPEGPIPIRIYWPSDAEGLPITVAYHGGGWVIGDIDAFDRTCREFATMAETIVVNVEYRLAPEHPYPGAADDSYAAYVWCVQNGERIGGDPSRIAVAGWSAGGNLAAVVAQMARDRGSGGGLVHQLLICPVLDHVRTQPSYEENGAYILTPDVMALFWDAYVPDESMREQPYISPVYAESLEGLAPAHVVTAQYDPLRDEGMAYAAALKAAGVPVVAKAYEGQIHTFFTSTHLYDVGAEAVADAAAELRRAFGTSS